MLVKIKGPASLSGRITVPGDKSISHRALIFSAMAAGKTRITGLLASADCLSTLNCLRRLGVPIEHADGEIVVDGVGFFGFEEPDDVLDVGNSGTALRILPALLAAQPFFSVLTGDSSIRRRPVDRIINPLAEMGGKFWTREDGRLAPVAVSGGLLTSIEYKLPVASAQVKTAVILAGLLADGRTTIIEPVISRDHSELMLDRLGAAVTVEPENGRRIMVDGKNQFKAQDIVVPGDLSAAAFFLAAAVLAGEGSIEIDGVGLNPTRTGFIEVLCKMSVEPKIAWGAESAGEPIGALAAARSRLIGTEIGGELIPKTIDELPLAALLATQAEGRKTIKDAAELRVKETDRIELVVAELSKMGAKIEGTLDGFIVEGPVGLAGATVDSHGDHRLAMMLAVAAVIAEGETIIEHAEAVDVSFPDFFEKLRSLGADIKVILSDS